MRFFLSLLISTIFGLAVKSQPIEKLLIRGETENLIVKHWSVNDGMASSSIKKINRTSRGELFVVTYNGISLLNGKNVKNYSSHNLPILKTNNVLDFCISNDSLFWIATDKGVLLFDENEFFLPKPLEILRNIHIESINIDQHNRVWIGTLSDGLFYFERGKIHKVQAIEGIEKEIISLLFCDNGNNIWIGTNSGKLYKYNGKTYKLIFEEGRQNTFLSAVQDEMGTYFFGTRDGLYIYKNGVFSHFNTKLKSVNGIGKDAEHNIWLTTENGLYFFDKRKQEFRQIFLQKNLTNQMMQSLFIDKQHNVMWIGTYRKGLYQIQPSIFKNVSFSEDKIDEVASALAEKRDSLLCIGTDQGNIYRVNKGAYGQNKEKVLGGKRQIKKIFVDSKNNRWVCSYTDLSVLKPNGRIRTFFSGNATRDIVETKEHNYWLATDHSGLLLINQNLEISARLDAKNGLSANFIMAITKGKENVYVATKKGVDVIKNNKIVKKYNTENGLISNLVFNTYEDSNDVLWVATIGGLSMIKDDKITNFDRSSGLEDERIFDVVEDDLGFLWFPMVKGILRVKKTDFIDFANGNTKRIFSAVFNQSDGMKNDQYVSASKVLKLSDGNLAFNTLDGVSILNPFYIDSVKSAPSFFIKKLSTESVSYFTTRKKQNNIPPNNKYFEIEFEYVDFTNVGKTEITYRLIPFDDDWKTTEIGKKIVYTNLPSGKYKLEVRAIIKSQKQTKLYDSIAFTIEAAFYEKVWFKLVAIVVSLIGLWLTYLFRLRRVNQRNRLLEKEVKERTLEIRKQKEILEIRKNELQKANASKDKMFSIIGHDLRGPIGTLKVYMDSIVSNYTLKKENVLDNLKTIQKTLQKTFDLLDNLLIWSRNQRNLISCEKKDFEIQEVIHKSIALVKEMAKKKEINIQTTIVKNSRVYADKNMITTILRNLISNSIKFTPSQGEINVVVTEKQINLYNQIKEVVEIKVIDSGVGIKQESIEMIKNQCAPASTFGTNKEEGTGLGLSICIDFLREHGQKLEVKNNETPDSNISGTTFSFHLEKSQANR